MQKAVERQNPVFRDDRMAGRTSLPGRDARRNDDIPEEGPNAADLFHRGIGSK
jgi:hypothetical protein